MWLLLPLAFAAGFVAGVWLGLEARHAPLVEAPPPVHPASIVAQQAAWARLRSHDDVRLQREQAT